MQREKEGGREGEGGRGNELVIILHRQLHKGGGQVLCIIAKIDAQYTGSHTCTHTGEVFLV